MRGPSAVVGTELTLPPNALENFCRLLATDSAIVLFVLLWVGPTVSDLFDFVDIWGSAAAVGSLWLLVEWEEVWGLSLSTPLSSASHEEHGKHRELGRGMLHLTQTCSQGKVVWHAELWYTKEWSGQFTGKRSCKKYIRDFAKSICSEVAFQKLLARGFYLQTIHACVFEPDMWDHIPVYSLLN